jgi:hypothetical protein
VDVHARQDISGAVLVKRHRHARAHCERVGGRQSLETKGRQRRVRVADGAELEDLGAEARQQRLGAVERHDAAFVHDRDAIAQPLGLVEVVGGHQNGELVSGPQARDHIE